MYMYVHTTSDLRQKIECILSLFRFPVSLRLKIKKIKKKKKKERKTDFVFIIISEKATLVVAKGVFIPWSKVSGGSYDTRNRNRISRVRK